MSGRRARFAITLGSALIAHFSLGDGPEVWVWSAGTGVLWGLSYFFWRRLEATPKRKDLAPARMGHVFAAPTTETT